MSSGRESGRISVSSLQFVPEVKEHHFADQDQVVKTKKVDSDEKKKDILIDRESQNEPLLSLSAVGEEIPVIVDNEEYWKKQIQKNQKKINFLQTKIQELELRIEDRNFEYEIQKALVAGFELRCAEHLTRLCGTLSKNFCSMLSDVQTVSMVHSENQENLPEDMKSSNGKLPAVLLTSDFDNSDDIKTKPFEKFSTAFVKERPAKEMHDKICQTDTEVKNESFVYNIPSEEWKQAPSLNNLSNYLFPTLPKNELHSTQESLQSSSSVESSSWFKTSSGEENQNGDVVQNCQKMVKTCSSELNTAELTIELSRKKTRRKCKRTRAHGPILPSENVTSSDDDTHLQKLREEKSLFREQKKLKSKNAEPCEHVWDKYWLKKFFSHHW